MTEQSHRDRVLRALSHQEPDRVPFDIGSSPNTTIVKIAYENLRRHLGLCLYEPVRMMSVAFQTVMVDEPILEFLDIDTRAVLGHPPDHSRGRVIGDESFIDEWGITRKAARSADGTILYYDIVEHPLAGATTVSEIETYEWPDPDDPGRVRGLREEVEALRRIDAALVGHQSDTAIFEKCWALRGMENFLVDLVLNKKMAQALLEKVYEIQSRKMEQFLAVVGDYLDIVAIGDDLATQMAPIISPALYREMIKPYHARYFSLIKSKTKARLKLHSCGAVEPLLDDLIDIGVEIINPVQVSAVGMNPKDLKNRYGEQLVFWGGIDSQNTLPYGSPEDVRREAVQRVSELGAGGGYILSCVHNIQADVPPENIVAMFRENGSARVPR